MGEFVVLRRPGSSTVLVPVLRVGSARRRRTARRMAAKGWPPAAIAAALGMTAAGVAAAIAAPEWGALLACARTAA
jgi:hypothetical protein